MMMGEFMGRRMGRGFFFFFSTTTPPPPFPFPPSTQYRERKK